MLLAKWLPRRTDAKTWSVFSSRRRHTRFDCDWSSDVCSSDLSDRGGHPELPFRHQPGIQPVRGRAGLARRPREGTRLHRTYGAEENQDRGTEAETRRRDRKSVVEGKSVDLGGRRII